MPFAHFVDGQPVELVPGRAFTTQTVRLTSAEEAAWWLGQYGIGDRAPVETQHSPEALLRYGAEDLDRFGIQVLEEPGAPAGQVVASRALAAVDGVISIVATFEPAPPEPRRLVRKSLVQERVHAIGKLGEALAALNADPLLFGRWFAPDWPSVYFDDEGLLAVLNGIGCTPEEIAAVTAPVEA